MSKSKNKGGRPTNYTQELADKICEELALGNSMRTVCTPDEMPAMSTIFSWLRTKPEFVEQYARAKEESTDAMAEEVLDISDNGTNDWMQVNRGRHASWVTNGEALQRSRLRVDTRKWLMSKMKPKKYGDKVDVTSGGEVIKGNSIILSNYKDDSTSK